MELSKVMDHVIEKIDMEGTTIKTWLYQGKVSFYMTLGCLVLSVFMTTPSVASLIVMLLLSIMMFLTRWVAKFEERMEPEVKSGLVGGYYREDNTEGK